MNSKLKRKVQPFLERRTSHKRRRRWCRCIFKRALFFTVNTYLSYTVDFGDVVFRRIRNVRLLTRILFKNVELVKRRKKQNK